MEQIVIGYLIACLMASLLFLKKSWHACLVKSKDKRGQLGLFKYPSPFPPTLTHAHLEKSPVIHKRTIKVKKQIQTGFGVSLSFIDNTSIVWHDRVRDSHWRFDKPSKAIITVEIRLISYQLLSTVYSGCSKVTVTYNLVLHYPQPNNVAYDRLIILSLHHFLSKKIRSKISSFDKYARL